MIVDILLNEPDLSLLVRFLDERLTGRKKRLLAVALCRLVVAQSDHPDLFAALDSTERYADGRAASVELEAGRLRCRELAVREYEVWAGKIDPTAREQRSEAAWAVAFAATTPIEIAAVVGKTLTTGDRLRTTDPVKSIADAAVQEWQKSEQILAHRARIADVAGHLFASREFRPEWRTSTTVAIADQMYELRDFSAMPILADALEDAGCDSDKILNHCRTPATHVRGCWVVDQVLGKA